jgi:hypothetical protein
MIRTMLVSAIDILKDRKTGGLIDIYAKNSFWISAGDHILFLDIAKTRYYAQERGIHG